MKKRKMYWTCEIITIMFFWEEWFEWQNWCLFHVFERALAVSETLQYTSGKDSKNPQPIAKTRLPTATETTAKGAKYMRSTVLQSPLAENIPKWRDGT